MDPKRLKILETPKLNNPYLVAAWPGMGNVAIKAGQYLKEKTNAIKFAEIKSLDFFSPSDIVVNENEIKLPDYPAGEFFYYITGRKNDLIIFTCASQPEIEKEYEYANLILKFAEKLGVKKIFTFAAMPTAMEHTQLPQVHAAVTNRKQILNLETLGVKIMSNGRISGLNGLLLGVAKENNIDGLCLLGEIPFYTVQLENPKASLEVLRVLCQIIEIRIDFNGLEQETTQLEQNIENFFEYLDIRKLQNIVSPQNNETGSDENIQKIMDQDIKIDPQIKTKIDKMFEHVKNDLSRAKELKKELDKLGIYKEYEDRFLDLFRPRDRKDQH